MAAKKNPNLREHPTAREFREENARLNKVNKELGQTVKTLEYKISELEEEIEAPDPKEVAELKEKIENLEYEIERLEEDDGDVSLREELEFLSKDLADSIRTIKSCLYSKNFEPPTQKDYLKLFEEWKRDIDKVLEEN